MHTGRFRITPTPGGSSVPTRRDDLVECARSTVADGSPWLEAAEADDTGALITAQNEFPQTQTWLARAGALS